MSFIGDFVGKWADRFLSHSANHRRLFEYGGFAVILAPFGIFLWFGMSVLAVLWVLWLGLFVLFGVLHSWKQTISSWQTSLQREMIAETTVFALLNELRLHDEAKTIEIVRQHMAMMALSEQHEGIDWIEMITNQEGGK